MKPLSAVGVILSLAWGAGAACGQENGPPGSGVSLGKPGRPEPAAGTSGVAVGAPRFLVRAQGTDPGTPGSPPRTVTETIGPPRTTAPTAIPMAMPGGGCIGAPVMIAAPPPPVVVASPVCCDTPCPSCELTVCCDLGPCDPCGPGFYVNGEYLLWWIRDPRVPPLITTGPVNAGGIGGALGQPDTFVLFGGRELDYGTFSGGRVAAGVWCDPDETLAIEASGFYLGQQSVNFGVTSDQFPVLARPFFNLNADQEFREVVTAPELSTGAIIIEAPSQLWGADLNVRKNVLVGPNYVVDLFAGARYVDLDEGLQIREAIVVDAGVPDFGGARITVLDRFDTRNQFVGGQVGVATEYHWRRWSLDLRGRVAIGGTRQSVHIAGGQQIAGALVNNGAFRGGLLTQPSNIGDHERRRFSIVPEIGVNLAFHFTENLRAMVGYNLLYWTNVVRPGDQIDVGIDVSQIANFPPPVPNSTGTRRPAALFRETDFWAHGLTAGLEWRF